MGLLSLLVAYNMINKQIIRILRRRIRIRIKIILNYKKNK